MEPQRRELLAQCQQSLAQAMTEVEAVLGLLEAAGALSPGERRQLDEEAGGAKAELLLKLLLAKERDHFQDLRAALEKTQPHLLPILYLNGVVGPPQPAEGAGECQTPARPLASTSIPSFGSLPRRISLGPLRYTAIAPSDTFSPLAPAGSGRRLDPEFTPPSPVPPVSVNNAAPPPGLLPPRCHGCRVPRRPPGPVAASGLRGALEGRWVSFL